MSDARESTDNEKRLAKALAAMDLRELCRFMGAIDNCATGEHLPYAILRYIIKHGGFDSPQQVP